MKHRINDKYTIDIDEPVDCKLRVIDCIGVGQRVMIVNDNGSNGRQLANIIMSVKGKKSVKYIDENYLNLTRENLYIETQTSRNRSRHTYKSISNIKGVSMVKGLPVVRYCIDEKKQVMFSDRKILKNNIKKAAAIYDYICNYYKVKGYRNNTGAILMPEDIIAVRKILKKYEKKKLDNLKSINQVV